MTCIGKDPRCPCQDGDACHYKDCGNTKAWPVPQAEPVACRFCHDKKGCWAWQCDSCGEIDDVQQPPPLPVQEPVAWMRPSEEGYDSAFRDHHTIVTCTGNLWKGWLPLYTAPPAAQPVQEPETFERWNAKQHGDPEEIGFLQALRIAYCAGQNSVTTPPLPVQRQWVGLTKQDMPSGENPMFDHKYFCAGMVYAAKVLQDKNHG